MTFWTAQVVQTAYACPSGSYAASVQPGWAVLVMHLWDRDNVLPWVFLDSIAVPTQGVVHDITVQSGTRLLGGATLDGQPLVGAALGFRAYGISFGVDWTAADGSWQYYGRPLVLQNGVTYGFSCNALGASPETLYAPPVLFPTQSDRFDCPLKTSPAAAFSHTSTRLALTVGPAALGYNLPGRQETQEYGLGWGLQYPIDPSTGPSHARGDLEIQNAGLVVGLPTGMLLGSATQVGNLDPFNIGLPARGKLSITDLGTAGKQIFWQYDDQGLADAPGLDVSQKSWDGTRGDYVLLQYRIRNRGVVPIEIAPGLLMTLVRATWRDTETLGATGWDGRLIYVRVAGRYVGSLLVGGPVTPASRFVYWPSRESVNSALRGQAGATSVPVGTEAWFPIVQGSGAVTLKPGHKTDLAVAVIGGMTLDELLANAAAAEAEYASKP